MYPTLTLTDFAFLLQTDSKVKMEIKIRSRPDKKASRPKKTPQSSPSPPPVPGEEEEEFLSIPLPPTPPDFAARRCVHNLVPCLAFPHCGGQRVVPEGNMEQEHKSEKLVPLVEKGEMGAPPRNQILATLPPFNAGRINQNHDPSPPRLSSPSSISSL